MRQRIPSFAVWQLRFKPSEPLPPKSFRWDWFCTKQASSLYPVSLFFFFSQRITWGKKLLTVVQRTLVIEKEPSTDSVRAGVGISGQLLHLVWDQEACGALPQGTWGRFCGEQDVLMLCPLRLRGNMTEAGFAAVLPFEGAPCHRVLLRCELVTCSRGSRSALGSVK